MSQGGDQMDNQNGSSSWATKDITVPLLISGVLATGACVILCIVLSVYGKSLPSDSFSDLGLAEPTMGPMECPALPVEWGIKLQDQFVDNKLGWFLGSDSSEYGHTNTRIEDGLLKLDIKSVEGVFMDQEPNVNATLRDFYFLANMRVQNAAPDTDYGLVVRVDGNDMYYFYVDDVDAYVQVWDDDDGWGDAMYSDHPILVYPGAMNELAVIHKVDETLFCVNDQVALALQDIGNIFGDFGVAASATGQEETVNFEFDDFVVYMPPKPK
jgi:hypothetical protein